MAKFHPHLPQAYKGLDPEKHLSHLSSTIWIEDKKLIKHVCPTMGLFQQMSQLFFASIANELRNRNITHYTPENEHKLISIIRRRTATITNRQAVTRHVRGRVADTHEEIKRAVQQFNNNKVSD